MLLLAAFAFLADGVGTQVMGLALPALLHDWHLPRAAMALPTALGLVGFTIGAVLGGLSADRFGVLRALIGSLLLLGLSTAGCSLAHDPAQLGMWRIAAGLGLGASLPVAAAIIADFSTERRRGMAMAVGLAFLPLGGFMAGQAAPLIIPMFGWRGLFAVGGAVSVLFAGCAGLGGGFARIDPGAARAVRGHTGSMLRLEASVRDTLGLWLAFFFTVLIFYSMFSWAPTALSARGLSIAEVSRVVSVFSLGGLVGGLATGLLLQWFGSRGCLTLLAIGAVASGLALPHMVPNTTGATLTALVLCTGTLGFTVVGIQTLLFALGAEVYSIAHRATGLGLAVGWGRVGAIVSSYTGVMALDRGGFQGFCASLVLAVLLALLAGLLVSKRIPARFGQARPASA